MRRNCDNEMGPPGSRLKASPCVGLLLASAFLAGIPCHATSKQTSPSCSGGKAVVGQGFRQVANTKDSDAAAPDHPTSHSIKLTWDRSVSPKSAVAGYNIFRHELGPNCRKNDNDCDFKQLNPPDTPITGTTCTDYAVQPGRTYIYEVQTVGTNTKVSAMSNRARATLP